MHREIHRPEGAALKALRQAGLRQLWKNWLHDRRARRNRRPDLRLRIARRFSVVIAVAAVTLWLPWLLAAALGWAALVPWSLSALGLLLLVAITIQQARTLADELAQPLHQLSRGMAQFAQDRDASLPAPSAIATVEMEALYTEFRRSASRLRGTDAQVRTTMADSQRLRSELEKVLNQQDAVIAARTSELERKAMQLAAANTELEKMAAEDGLTGLSNRRAFDNFLDTAWRHSMRQGHPVALLLIDVDNFKAYNDTYGHPMGDSCLQRVAQVLKEHARRSLDLVARYGGEEFVVVLPDTGSQHAAKLAQRISQAVRALQIPSEAGVDGIVTVSLGVAALTPRRGIGPDVLVEQADSALYRAKRNGRDTVEVADGTDGDALAEVDAA